MLDAVIKMLETIVAMEEIGNIDVDDVLGFSFGDIFKTDENDPKKITGFTQEYSNAVDHILELAKDNKELAAGLKGFQINGHTLEELLQVPKLDGDINKNLENLGLTADQYFAIIDSFVEMA
jgi:hypothetical protein